DGATLMTAPVQSQPHDRCLPRPSPSRAPPLSPQSRQFKRAASRSAGAWGDGGPPIPGMYHVISIQNVTFLSANPTPPFVTPWLRTEIRYRSPAKVGGAEQGGQSPPFPAPTSSCRLVPAQNAFILSTFPPANAQSSLVGP